MTAQVALTHAGGGVQARWTSRRFRRMSVTTVACVMVLSGIADLSELGAQAPSREFLVSDGKAGSIEVGMSVDEVLQAFGKEQVRLVNLNKEGHFTPPSKSLCRGATVAVPITADLTEGPCGGFSLGARVVFIWLWSDPKTVRKQRCPER